MVSFGEVKSYKLKELKFDRKNTRISHLRNNLSESEIMEALLKLSPKLENDILDRGVQEELVLHSTSNVVIEGNTRLACLINLNREFQKTQLPSEQLKKFADPDILCKRFVDKTTKKDIDIYLAEIHIGRKRDWLKPNRARFLYNLRYKQNLSIHTISRVARISVPTVYKEINAYKYYTKYEELHHDPSVHKKFFYFWEFLNPNLKEFRKKESNVNQFMKWIHMGKFTNSKHIRYLQTILNDATLHKTFLDHTMDDAIDELVKKDPAIYNTLFKYVKVLIDKFEKLSKYEHPISKNSSEYKLLHELRSTVDKLLSEVKQS